MHNCWLLHADIGRGLVDSGVSTREGKIAGGETEAGQTAKSQASVVLWLLDSPMGLSFFLLICYNKLWNVALGPARLFRANKK
jgi:hypothetical protein